MGKTLKLKTYSQWKTDNPTFYSDLLGDDLYAETFTKICDDWFGLRVLGDEESRFNRFYARNINNTFDRYKEIVKLEQIRHSADFAVYDFSQTFNYNQNDVSSENKVLGTEGSTSHTTGNRSDSSSKDSSDSTTITYGKQVAVSGESKNTGTQKTDNTGTQKIDNTGTVKNTYSDEANSSSSSSGTAESEANSNSSNSHSNKQLSKALPMNQSEPLGSASAEFTPSSVLKWGSASSQAETEESNSDNSTNKNKSSSSSESSSDSSSSSNSNRTDNLSSLRTDALSSLRTDDLKNTNTSTSKDSGSDLNVRVGNDSSESSNQYEENNTGSKNTSQNGTSSSNSNGSSISVSSGRGGHSISEIVTEAYKSIRKFCSIDFVYDELSKCFLNLYLDDDEYDLEVQ